MPRSILSELKQYLADAMPGGKLNRELTFNVNESPVPRAVAGIRSFFGEAPDELGVSVMDPRYKDIKSVADKAYWAGKVTEAIPALGALKRATAPARLVGGYSGAIPMSEFEANASKFIAPEGRRTLFHASNTPWEGKTPKPGSWFSSAPPTRDNPFGQTVRAYTIPNDVPISAPIPRGGDFYTRKLPSVKEPIAAIDEGNGAISYVVKDPSVLNRLEVQRSLSRPVNRQTGSVGNIDKNRIMQIERELARSRYGNANLSPDEARNMLSVSEALDRSLKRAEQQKIYPRVEDENSWPSMFYRGIRGAVENNPKFSSIEELPRELLESANPLSQVSSLNLSNRPVAALTQQANSPKGSAWATSNPLLASSYAADPNSLVVPLRLAGKPDAIMDAGGSDWVRFFSQTGRLNKGSYSYPLNTEFKTLLKDPDVRSILIKNIYDLPEAALHDPFSRRMSELYGVDLRPENFIADNLLVKDPSAVRYGLTGEQPNMLDKVNKFSKGGLAQYKECSCHGN